MGFVIFTSYESFNTNIVCVLSIYHGKMMVLVCTVLLYSITQYC